MTKLNSNQKMIEWFNKAYFDHSIFLKHQLKIIQRHFEVRSDFLLCQIIQVDAT